MNILKSDKKGFIWSGVVYLLVGVLMCAWPVGTAEVMCVIAGGALIVSAVVKASVYFRKKDYGLMPRVDFASSALLVLLGLLLFFRPDVFMSLVPFILGMMILVNSVFQMQIALELHAAKYGAWWHYLAVSLGCGILALIMMFDPFGSYRLVAVFMGLAFLVDGAADLWTALYLKKKLGQAD